MLKKIPKSVKNFFYPLIAVAFLLLFWYLLALAVGKDFIVPSPASTFAALGIHLSEPSFYAAVGGTLLRSVESYVLSAVLALLLSLVATLFEAVRRLFAPVIAVMRAVPTMSFILLSVIWLKPVWSPILVSFLISFPVLYSGFLSSFSRIDPKLVEMSKIYCVSFKDKVFRLYFPSVLPSALDTLGATASLNVKIVISAEVLAATANSIGQSMQIDKIYLETASLLAWTLVAIALSYLFELIFFAVKKMAVRWER